MVRSGEIDAGGSFSSLAGKLGAIHLTENRRQVEEWERNALDELRHGDVGAALDSYEAAGRLHDAGNALRTKEVLASDFCDVYLDDPNARMFAARRNDIDELNGLARQGLRSRGRLGDDVYVGGSGIGYARGEEVMCLRNDAFLGVVNGERGQVLDATPEGLVVSTSKGVRTIGEDYLAAGHLTYGYASTIHKAQGATVDRAFVYGTASLFRESGYVAMSRARQRTDLYVVSGAFDHGYERVHGPERSHPELRAALETSRAKSRAMDELAQSRAAGNGHLAPNQALTQSRCASNRPHNVDDNRAYLTDTLGPFPESAELRSSWNHAASRIEDYRQRFDVTDRSSLGPPPLDPEQQAQYHDVLDAVIKHAHHREKSVERDAMSHSKNRGRGI